MCERNVQFEKTFFVESHRKSAGHQNRLTNAPLQPPTQQFISFPSNSLTNAVTHAFVAADIPLKKLRHPSIKNLFEFMGKTCPSESSCRSLVCDLAADEKRKIKEQVGEKQIFIIADECQLFDKHFFTILVGTIDNPSETHVIDCIQTSTSVNSQFVVQHIDDALRFLEIPRSHFVLLLSDAARYMQLSGRLLKDLYPFLYHVTCIAHLLHNSALKIRANTPLVDNVIARVKACLTKNSGRRDLFRQAGLYPPQAIVTRWTSWLRVAIWYAEKLPEVREVVSNFTSEGLLVSQAKEAISNPRLTEELVKIYKYKDLIDLSEKSQGSSYSIKQAAADLSLLTFEDDPFRIKEYIGKRLNGNDINSIIERTRQDVSPATYSLLECCQPTTAAVERSFSQLNTMLRSDRNFSPENIASYVILRRNSK